MKHCAVVSHYFLSLITADLLNAFNFFFSLSPLSLDPLCKLIYGLIKGQASRYEGTQITGPYQMAEKWHRIIENLEVDQYLEAQGYMKYDNTINMEIWCITSAGKLTSVAWWRNSEDWEASVTRYTLAFSHRGSASPTRLKTLTMCWRNLSHASPFAHLHACGHPIGQPCRSGLGGLPADKMWREGSEADRITDPPQAHTTLLQPLTSGLLKMISARGGQALAFAFYWKHRDLEQRIYQLWADRIS